MNGVFFLLLLPAVAVATGGRWDKLNGYLGPIEFQCLPDETIDIAKLWEENPALKNLPVKFPILGDVKLGNLLRSGTIELQNLACGNVRIGDIVLKVITDTPTLVELDVMVSALHIHCTGNMKYEKLDFFSTLFPTMSGTLAFETSNDGLSDTQGIQASIGVQFHFDDPASPPSSLTIRPGEAARASSNPTLMVTIPKSMIKLPDSKFLNFFVGLFIGTVEGTLSQILEGLGEYKDSSGKTVDGAATQALEKLNELIKDMAGNGTNINLPREEASIVNAIEKKHGGSLPKGILSMDNSVLRMVSAVVDDIMSSKGSGIYKDTLVINEVLDRVAGVITGTTPEQGFMNAALALNKAINVTTPLSAGEMTIQNISLMGLDTFNAFDVLDPPKEGTNFTLTNKLGMDRVAFSAHSNITLGPGECVKKGSVGTIGFDFKLGITIQTLAVQLATAMLLDPALVEDKQIGQFLSQGFSSLLSCAGPSLYGVNLTELTLASSNIGDPFLDGFLDVGFEEMLQNVLSTAVRLYRPVLSEDLPGITQAFVRPIINDLIHSATMDAGTCPAAGSHPKVDNPDKPWVDFNSDTASIVRDVINSVFGIEGDSSVNQIIRVATGALGWPAGQIAPKGVLFNMSTDGLGIVVEDLLITGLDTFSEFEVLMPLASDSPLTRINNSMALASKEKPLQISLKVKLDLDKPLASPNPPHKNGIHDTLAIKLTLDRVGINIAADARVNMLRIYGLALKQCTNVDCLMAILDADSKFLGFGLDVEGFGIDIDCASGAACSSSALGELHRRLTSDKGSAELAALVRDTLKNNADIVTDSDFKEPLSSARRECDGTAPPAGKKEGMSDPKVVAKAFNIILVCANLGMIIFFLGIGFGVYQRRKRHCKDRQKGYDARFVSLFQHPSTPPSAKYIIPFVLVSNLVIFYFAHTTHGASIDLVVEFAGDNIRVEQLFAFTLGGSVTDMWNAGVYPLALLIAVFSGAWPYIKLYMLLWAWFTPSIVISPKRRGHMLMVLDIVGKWSLIDAYVLVQMMCAFRMHVAAPSTWSDFVPTDAVVIDVIVTPREGIYFFLFAAMTSLGISHACIAFHRNAISFDEQRATRIKDASSTVESFPVTIKEDEDAFNDEDEELGKRKLRRSSFEVTLPATESFRTQRRQSSSWFNAGTDDMKRARRGSVAHSLLHGRRILANHWYRCVGLPYKAKLGPAGIVLFASVLVLTLVLTIWGSIVDVFAFDFKGLAGIALAGQKNFSIVSIATTLGEQLKYDFEPDAGIRFIQVVFLLFALVVPFLQMVLLSVLWAAPLRLKEWKILFFVNEILSAWSSMEVFIVSVVAALMEISQFAQFMVGDKCDFLKPVLTIFFNGELCFDVVATLKSGCIVLFLAAVFNNILCQLIVRTAEKAIEDVEGIMRGKTEAEIEADEMNELSSTFGRCGLQCHEREMRFAAGRDKFLAMLRILTLQDKENPLKSVTDLSNNPALPGLVHLKKPRTLSTT